MNYGLYVAASGALTGMHRLDVASNNLANVNTVAFKPDFAVTRQRDAERVENPGLPIDSNRLLERLGGGVLMQPTRTSLSQGATYETANPLDAAIIGDGFFVVDTGKGAGDDPLRFTRDGRFTLDSRARLVTAARGLPVLDSAGSSITLDPDQAVEISPSGDIRQGGQTVAAIQITALADPESLRKTGDNLFQLQPGRSAARVPSSASLRAGALEASAVDAIRAMMAVTNASGDVRRNARMMELHDELMGRAINTFGRIG